MRWSLLKSSRASSILPGVPPDWGIQGPHDVLSRSHEFFSVCPVCYHHWTEVGLDIFTVDFKKNFLSWILHISDDKMMNLAKAGILLHCGGNINEYWMVNKERFVKKLFYFYFFTDVQRKPPHADERTICLVFWWSAHHSASFIPVSSCYYDDFFFGFHFFSAFSPHLQKNKIKGRNFIVVTILVFTE